MPIVADENVPVRVIERLRNDGFTVLSINDAMAGVSDETVIEEAHSRNYLLITADRDFGELAIKRRLPVAGVLLLQIERLSTNLQVERVSGCLAKGEAYWIGYFSVIEPGRERRRKIPPV
jgi:predicted nuclease of predicted toxin-antitoxin system